MGDASFDNNRPLTEGEPSLGWEGDSRLVIYLHLKNQNFVLFRLEADNDYKPIAKLPTGRPLDQAQINSLIVNLIKHDHRRGFDPYEEIMAAQEKIRADEAQVRADQMAQLGDKIHWGLARSYLPGIDITRPRQLLPRR